MFLKRCASLVIIFSALVFSRDYGKDHRQAYGYRGVWGESGLVGNFSMGSFAKKSCSDALTQWRGGVQFLPDSTQSWGGHVEVVGGSIDADKSISTTRYVFNYQRYEKKTTWLFSYGLSAGIDQTVFQSLQFDKEVEPVCEGFQENLGAGVVAQSSVGIPLGKWVTLTGDLNLGVTYSGGFFNEVFSGVALNMPALLPGAWREMSAFYLYLQVMTHFDGFSGEVMGFGGVSLGF